MWPTEGKGGGIVERRNGIGRLAGFMERGSVSKAGSGLSRVSTGY